MPKAFSARASLSGVPIFEHRVSTQWSTALMPVLSHIESGVVDVSTGSRITRRGPRVGFWKECLRSELSFVPPAKLLYSPADSEVGIEMIGIVGGLILLRLSGPSGRVARSEDV